MPKLPKSTPILQVRGLKTWFPIRRGIISRTTGYIKAVDGVSFFVQKGETVGLVGESGCGKSTLGRTIIGLEKPHAGDIVFYGKIINEQSSAELKTVRQRMQIIFQDPYSSLNPRMTILDILTEALIQHKLIKKSDKEAEAARLMTTVGLDENAIFRYPHEFSGGQRQRICIARAMSLRPDFVICDEAVSALDVSVQAQIINLLCDLRDEFHLSYLFISHDISVVKHISNRILVMYLGHLVEEGLSRDITDKPLHPYTKALIASVPAPGAKKSELTSLAGEIPSAAQPPPGCPFHTRCPDVMDRCRSAYPMEKTIGSSRVSCHLYD